MAADALNLRVVDVSVLRLQPGDVLSMRFDPKDWASDQTGEAIGEIRAALDDAGHGDIPLLAFWGSVEIEVVRPE